MSQPSESSWFQRLNYRTVREDAIKGFNWIWETAKDQYKEHLPGELASAKELRWKYIFLIGLVSYGTYCGFFAWFMTIAYKNALEVKYVSFKNGEICSPVPVKTYSSYLADTDGNWIGENDFVFSRAAFQLVLSGFAVEQVEQYEAMMVTFKNAVTMVSAKTDQYGLIYSLLAWMSFIRYYSVDSPETTTNFHAIGFGKLQYFQFTGSASAVFNLRSTQFRLGSQRGVCDVHSRTENNPLIYEMSVAYNYEEFVNSSLCNGALHPSTFDLYSYSNDEFNFYLDTRSFSTAMAVNYGILKLSELAPVANSYHNITVNGVIYTMAQYFDTRFPGMDPIACYQNATYAYPDYFLNSQLCLLIKGPYTLGLPVFNHVGSSPNLTQPAYCGPNVNNDDCNQFKLMSGLVVYPTEDTSETFARDIALMKKQMAKFISMLDSGPYSTYEEFNRAAYNASFIVAVSGSSSAHVDGQYTTQAFFNQSFEFCRSNGSDANSDTCSLMLFYQYDYSNNFVSDYNFRLNNVTVESCFGISDAAWESMISRPPMKLVEPYFKCNTSTGDAFQSAQGVAAGNVDTVLKFVVFFLSLVVYFLLYGQKKEPEIQEYRKEHKQELADELSNLLLRAMHKDDPRPPPPPPNSGNGLLGRRWPFGSSNAAAAQNTASPPTNNAYTPVPHELNIDGISENGPIMAFALELKEYIKRRNENNEVTDSNTAAAAGSAAPTAASSSTTAASPTAAPASPAATNSSTLNSAVVESPATVAGAPAASPASQVIVPTTSDRATPVPDPAVIADHTIVDFSATTSPETAQDFEETKQTDDINSSDTGSVRFMNATPNVINPVDNTNINMDTSGESTPATTTGM